MDKVEAIYRLMGESRSFPYVEGGQFDFCMQDEQVVGFVYVRPINDNEAEIIYVGVLPLFRRKGLARGFIQALQKSYGKLYLEVEETNQAAFNLYESLGFCIQRKRLHYYGSGRHAFDMSWLSGQNYSL